MPAACQYSLIYARDSAVQPPGAQDRLQALLEERKQVIEDADAGQPKTRKAGAEVKGFDTGDMVAKEAKRLEVQKRRQEREMQQIIAFEKMRKELQVRVPTSCCNDFTCLLAHNL